LLHSVRNDEIVLFHQSPSVQKNMFFLTYKRKRDRIGSGHRKRKTPDVAGIPKLQLLWVGGKFCFPYAKRNLYDLLNCKERTRNMEKRRAENLVVGLSVRREYSIFWLLL